MEAESTPTQVQAPETKDEVKTEESSDVNKGNGKEPVDRDLSQPLMPEEKKRYKLKTKVNGVESEDEYDEDQLKYHIQMSKSSGQRFQEAAAKDKRAEEFFGMLKDKAKLVELIKKVGHDPLALSEEYLAQELEYKLLTPEQKRIRDLEREKSEREFRDKERDEKALSAEEAKTREELRGKFQKEIIATLDKSNLAKTPQMVARMAKKMELFIKNGIKDLGWDDAARLVEEDLIAEDQPTLRAMPLPKLKSILGDELIKAILKDSIAQVKDPMKPTEKNHSQSVQERISPKDRKPFVSPNDFEKHMQKFRGVR